MKAKLSLIDKLLFLLNSYRVNQDIQRELANDIIDMLNAWLLDEFKEGDEDYV